MFALARLAVPRVRATLAPAANIAVRAELLRIQDAGDELDHGVKLAYAYLTVNPVCANMLPQCG